MPVSLAAEVNEKGRVTRLVARVMKSESGALAGEIEIWKEGPEPSEVLKDVVIDLED
jgi:hypothetical protein